MRIFGPFFVIVGNGIYYKWTRFVYLIQMMHLLVVISLRLKAVIESFYLNEEGKYCENESGCFTVPWRDLPKMRMYLQLFDFMLPTQSMGHSPGG